MSQFGESTHPSIHPLSSQPGLASALTTFPSSLCRGAADSSLIHPNCVKFVKVLYENFRRRDIFRLEDLYTYDWHQLTES